MHKRIFIKTTVRGVMLGFIITSIIYWALSICIPTKKTARAQNTQQNERYSILEIQSDSSEYVLILAPDKPSPTVSETFCLCGTADSVICKIDAQVKYPTILIEKFRANTFLSNSTPAAEDSVAVQRLQHAFEGPCIFIRYTIISSDETIFEQLKHFPCVSKQYRAAGPSFSFMAYTTT